MGLFLDWCPLDLEAVTGFRSGRPASILQVSKSVHELLDIVHYCRWRHKSALPANCYQQSWRQCTIDSDVYLNLPTLKYRRLRGDMVEVFKITHNIYDRIVSPDLPLNERANTRGNHYKLQNHTFHYDLRKHFFCTHCKCLEQLA